MCIISLDFYRICFSILILVKFIFYEWRIVFILCFIIDLIDKLPLTVKLKGTRFSWEVDN